MNGKLEQVLEHFNGEMPAHDYATFSAWIRQYMLTNGRANTPNTGNAHMDRLIIMIIHDLGNESTQRVGGRYRSYWNTPWWWNYWYGYWYPYYWWRY